MYPIAALFHFISFNSSSF